jgi:hypothetical protein
MFYDDELLIVLMESLTINETGQDQVNGDQGVMLRSTKKNERSKKGDERFKEGVE